MKYGRKGFDFGDFEITKREILASISIIAVMILFGILISSKISEHQMDKNEIYNKAVKIESQEMFQYGMDTNVGNAFVYGVLKELMVIMKDYSENIEYPAICAKIKKNTYDAYVNAGFTEDQALALMINDNIRLMENIKKSSNRVSAKKDK